MSKENDKDPLSLEEDEEIGADDENDNDEEVLEDFSCKYCEFQCTDIDELDEHIVSHEEAILEDNEEEEPSKTDNDEGVNNASPKFVVSPFNNSSHKGSDNYNIESADQAIKRVKQSVPAFYDEFKNKADKRVFVCPYCGYQTMKKLDMNKHMKVHSKPVEVPVYACAECPYTTRRKCDMPKHLLTHCKDGSVTMYKCDHCPYATKRKGDLPKHMVCHKKIEVDDMFYCHLCYFSTKRRGDLKKHQMSHEKDFTRKDNYLYNCTECGYTSKRLNDLHKHVVLHCDKAVKDFLKCTKCDYATEVSTHFAKHVLSNCQTADMGSAVFPKVPETVQDFIVLEEDELHLYQLDKESFTSVEALEKDTQVSNNPRKRKRTPNEDFINPGHSNLDYYDQGSEEMEASTLLEEVNNRGRKDKVLVLTGFENNQK